MVKKNAKKQKYLDPNENYWCVKDADGDYWGLGSSPPRPTFPDFNYEFSCYYDKRTLMNKATAFAVKAALKMHSSELPSAKVYRVSTTLKAVKLTAHEANLIERALEEVKRQLKNESDKVETGSVEDSSYISGHTNCQRIISNFTSRLVEKCEFFESKEV